MSLSLSNHGGPLTRAVLVRRLAQKLGHTPDRMDQVLDTVFETMNKALMAGGMVLIDGFGGFGPLNFTPQKRQGGAQSLLSPREDPRGSHQRHAAARRDAGRRRRPSDSQYVSKTKS